jgi:hypothetical protein
MHIHCSSASNGEKLKKALSLHKKEWVKLWYIHIMEYYEDTKKC